MEFTQIEIDSNVPVPATAQEKNEWKPLVDELEVGQSFLFNLKHRGAIANLVSTHYKAHTPKRFFISVKEQPAGKARIWRLKDEKEASDGKE